MSRWSTGLLAGLAAGAVMAGAMMVYMAATSRSVWTNPNLIAAMWFGERVADGRFGVATMVGLGTHMTTSALMGFVAVPFVRDLSAGRTLLASLSYAIASYPVVFALILSWANPSMFREAALVPMTFAHALFGVVFAVFYWRWTSR